MTVESRTRRTFQMTVFKTFQNFRIFGSNCHRWFRNEKKSNSLLLFFFLPFRCLYSRVIVCKNVFQTISVVAVCWTITVQQTARTEIVEIVCCSFSQMPLRKQKMTNILTSAINEEIAFTSLCYRLGQENYAYCCLRQHLVCNLPGAKTTT